MTLEHLGPTLEREWQDLARRLSAPPFLHPGWFRAWHTAFGNGHLDVVTVRRDSQLSGILPLEVTRGVARSPTNWHTPGFGMLACGGVDAARLAERACRLPVRRVDLGHLDPADRAAIERAAEAEGRATTAWIQQRSPYVDTTGDLDAYLDERDQRWLRQLEKRRQRLGKSGPLQLVVIDSTDALDALLDEGFALEASGWKGQAGTAISSSPTTDRFYRELARWAHAEGMLRLAFLRLAGRAVAFDFALEHAGVHYFLKTGFDHAESRSAPGLILRRTMVVRAFEQGLSSYEMLGGAEAYKLEWTTRTRPRSRVMVFDRSIPGRIDHVVQTRVRPAAKSLRSVAQRWGDRVPRSGAEPHP